MQPNITNITTAAETVYSEMPATPQYCWPLLCDRLGTEVWIKHENHTPVGAFKIRGGLVYFDHLIPTGDLNNGVVSATKGNHGQSIGFAARRYGIPATVVVPKGNSLEKNAAMRALGVELIEYGEDFQESREYTRRLAQERGMHMMPSFHSLLVSGVATYSYELLKSVPEPDVVYVPIGMGSGICGMIAVRDALGLKTEIVGVVSAHARAYAESFDSGEPVESPVNTKLADGLACRIPDPDALEVIRRGVGRIVTVTDDEIALAMRTIFECTHNVSEGAGAAGTAAAIQEKSKIAGRRVAVVITGGNVDSSVFASVLSSGVD